MAVRADPEGYEIHALLTLVGDLQQKRVLEVGCGDGRLTWRYAAGTGHVTAIDPDRERIGRAQADCPDGLEKRVTFLPIGLEEFASGAQAGAFDLAIMSWSL